MSLFLGNLSAHIQQEDLEHVFQRFGRCSVRMKDGYGFVIFEEPFNAEKALRALRGKLICGEQINLSWSNKQPRNFQKFTRNSRFYEPPRRRNFRDGDLNSAEYDRRDFAWQRVNNLRALHLTDSRDKEREHRRHTDFTGDVEGRKEGGKVIAANEYDPVGNGRWGEPVNAEDDNLVGNGADFDRYEPNHDYDAKVFDGNGTSGSYGSPAPSRSLEKRENSGDAQLKHLDNLRQQPVCYNCGLLGHVMRNCPRGSSSRIDKSSRFHDRRFRDKDGGGRDEEEQSRRAYEERATDGDSLHYGQHFRTGSKFDHKSRKRLLKGRHKLTDTEGTFRNKKREVVPPRKRSDRLDSRSPKKHLKKRKRHASASLDSDSNGTGSPTHSVSSGSQIKTISRSNSRSSSSRPSNSRRHSSGSRSASVSSYSRPKHRRWRSRSRSDSRSRSRSRSRMSIPESLSISLDRKCASSEQKANAGDSDAPSFNDQQRVASIRKSGNLEENIHNPGQELALDAEIVDTAIKPGDAFCEKYQDGGLQDQIFSESNVAPSVKDGQAATLEKFPGMEDRAGSAKPSTDSFDAPDMPNSIGMPTQEMFTVLRHYGLEIPDNFENGSTVRAFFGAVRFWPWELIYYRRLKKGSISTENYARRVQQNKEFGIVDKYIRSSSGWVVCTENEP